MAEIYRNLLRVVGAATTLATLPGCTPGDKPGTGVPSPTENIGMPTMPAPVRVPGAPTNAVPTATPGAPGGDANQSEGPVRPSPSPAQTPNESNGAQNKPDDLNAIPTLAVPKPEDQQGPSVPETEVVPPAGEVKPTGEAPIVAPTPFNVKTGEPTPGYAPEYPTAENCEFILTENLYANYDGKSDFNAALNGNSSLHNINEASGGLVEQVVNQLINDKGGSNAFWGKYRILFADATSMGGAWTIVMQDKETGEISAAHEAVLDEQGNKIVGSPYLSLKATNVSAENVAWIPVPMPREGEEQRLLINKSGHIVIGFSQNNLITHWYKLDTDEVVPIADFWAVNSRETYNAQFEGMDVTNPTTWDKTVITEYGEEMNPYQVYLDIANRTYDASPEWAHIDEQYHNIVQQLRENYLREVYAGQNMTAEQIEAKIAALKSPENPHGLFKEMSENTPEGKVMISTPQEARGMLEGKQILSINKSDGLFYNHNWVNQNYDEATKLFLTHRSSVIFGVETDDVNYSTFQAIRADMIIVQYSDQIYGAVFHYKDNYGIDHYLPTRLVFDDNTTVYAHFVQGTDSTYKLENINDPYLITPLEDKRSYPFSLQSLLEYNLKNVRADTSGVLDQYGLEIVKRVNEDATQP